MKNLYLLFFLVVSLETNSQTIPSSRIVDWSNAGYQGAIPSPSVIHDVTQFGALGNGTTDDATAIRDAIDSLHGSRGVVYFPPGNYLIGSTIDLPDSVIIRGSSSDSTTLSFNLSGAIGNGFNITGMETAVYTLVLSGNERGSMSIVVDSALLFSPGDYAELVQNNGSWDSNPAPWSSNSVGQILHITNISGDTLHFDAPLRINYDTSLQLRIQRIVPATEVGIECLKIERADNVTTGVHNNVFYLLAANCWMYGVESSISIGSHIEIDASTNISIKGCYIHHSYLYDGTSTHGYGITLFDHSGQCLIENNIMRFLRHSFSLQTGANGNVIAYNYSREPNRSEFPSNYGADVSFHGHYPYANLIEGNIVQNIMIDQTWGPTGPLNTIFRNRAELFGIVMTSASDSMNFVGNEITNATVPYGNYTLSGNGHFQHGNDVHGTMTPPGTSSLPDSSYYLTGYPPSWTSTIFPSIGSPNVINSGSIPARDRYLSGSHFTACEDLLTVGVNNLENSSLKIYPNPASEYLIVSGENLSGTIILRDFAGKIINENKIISGQSEETIPLSNISEGIYLLEIFSEKRKVVKKIIIL